MEKDIVWKQEAGESWSGYVNIDKVDFKTKTPTRINRDIS